MAQEPVDVNWSSFLYELLTQLDDLQGAVIDFRSEQSVRDPRPTRVYGMDREVPLNQAQRETRRG